MMNLRNFVVWFWVGVTAASVAGGTTVAVLRTPSHPAAPGPLIRPTTVAFAAPALASPAIIMPLPPRPGSPWKPRPTGSRGEARRFAGPEHAARITVVPPVPPVQLAQAAPVRPEPRASRSVAARAPRKSVPVVTRTAPAAPPAEASERYYAWYPPRRRYPYYTYSYSPYSYYPYPYYYSYSY